MLFNYSKNSWDNKIESYFHYDLEVNRDFDFDDSILNLSTTIKSGLVAHFDSNNIKSWNGFTFKTLSSWDKAILSSFTINDIGLTGIDFNIVNNFSGETLNYDPNSILTLYPSSVHSYFSLIQDYGHLQTTYDFSGLNLNLKNKILQGSFKVEGFPNQTLPVRTEKGITFDFWISFEDKLSNILPIGETLNSLYPENEGIFFHMGNKATNKFEIYDVTKSGLTTSTGVKIYDDTISGTTYSGLAFYFKNNKIGYKTLIPLLNEDDEIVHNIFTGETSYNIFTGNTQSSWINLTIKFNRYVSIEECYDKSIPCDCCIPNDRKGRLTIYVNARPVHIFENWIEPIFDKINIDPSKQELIPYSISLGGGSQGLEYSLIPDENDDLVRNLNINKLIEETFGGTFSGSISQFKIYDIPLPTSYIIHNFKIEQKRYGRNETFGGNYIIVDEPFVKQNNIT